MDNIDFTGIGITYCQINTFKLLLFKVSANVIYTTFYDLSSDYNYGVVTTTLEYKVTGLKGVN